MRHCAEYVCILAALVVEYVLSICYSHVTIVAVYFATNLLGPIGLYSQ